MMGTPSLFELEISLGASSGLDEWRRSRVVFGWRAPWILASSISLNAWFCLFLCL
jgi:hypothetical protein